jgi:hypothetical protein
VKSQSKVAPLKPAALREPIDLEAEQSVLGAILLRPDFLDRVAVIITPEDFCQKPHTLIFQTMLDLRNSEKPIDLVSVASLLKERGQLEEAGGAIYPDISERACGVSPAMPSITPIWCGTRPGFADSLTKPKQITTPPVTAP